MWCRFLTIYGIYCLSGKFMVLENSKTSINVVCFFNRPYHFITVFHFSHWLATMFDITPDIVVKFLTALTSLFLLFYVFSSKNCSKSKLPLLPGPTGLPIVGYLPFLGSDLRSTFKNLADVYGPVFRVRLGTKDTVVITSPLLVKEVLRDNDVVFSNRVPTVAAKITVKNSDIAFADYGPEWRKMKKIFVSEMLNNANLDASYYHRKENLKTMIRKAYKNAGEIVDVGELVFYTIFGSVMSMVWGDAVAVDAGFRSVLAEFMSLLSEPNVSDFLPCFGWFDLQGVARRMKSCVERFDKLFDLAIERHRAAGENRQKDFLGCLLQLTTLDDPATSLTLAQVKGILTDAIVGGMDTTVTTLEWAMAETVLHSSLLTSG